MPRRCLAIVNPRGGARQGLTALEQMRQALQAAGAALDSLVTEHPTHAGELALETDLSPYDCLCVVGGDGTVHSVVNGLMRRDARPEIPIALAPAGTGNTLHQDLHCSTVERTIDAILARRTRWMDLVELTSAGRVTYCANIVGWGAISDVNLKAERLRRFGRCRYALAALWQIALAPTRHARLTLDGDVTEGLFQFVIACVTRSTGSGMLLAPRAEIDDGRVDLVVVRDASRRELLQLFRRVYNGSHESLPFVECRQVQRFAVEADASPLNLDGEVAATSPFTARVIPRALQVLCNVEA